MAVSAQSVTEFLYLIMWVAWPKVSTNSYNALTNQVCHKLFIIFKIIYIKFDIHLLQKKQCKSITWKKSCIFFRYLQRAAYLFKKLTDIPRRPRSLFFFSLSVFMLLFFVTILISISINVISHQFFYQQMKFKPSNFTERSLTDALSYCTTLGALAFHYLHYDQNDCGLPFTVGS